MRARMAPAWLVAAWLVALASIAGAGAVAAEAQTVLPAPVRQSVDANGVDLFDGTFTVARQDGSIGPRDGGLGYSRIWRNGAWTDTYDIHLFKASGSTSVTVAIGGAAEVFGLSGSTYVNQQGGGSTLSLSGGTYTYTTANGTVYQFQKSIGYTALDARDEARVSLITQPNGVSLSFAYDTVSFCTRIKAAGDDTCVQRTQSSRVSTITSNLGYRVAYGFADNDVDSPGFLNQFYTVTSVALTNLATPTAPAMTMSYPNGATATDMAGRSWSYQFSSDGISAIQRPGHAADITIGYDPNNHRVIRYQTPATTTTYVYNDDTTANERTTYIGVGAYSSKVVFDLTTRLMKRSTDENNHTTYYEHDSFGRLTKVTATEGNYLQYDYDARGNVTHMLASPKDHNSQLESWAGYPASCANPRTCNLPVTTTNSRHMVTDYAYDANTGLPVRVTRPAAANGIRPQLRYGYTTATTSYGAGGTLTLLQQTSSCRTQTSCAGTSDESIVAFSYYDQTTNFLPHWMVRQSGDNALSSAVSYGYDTIRNVSSVTDPLGNVTRMTYMSDRQTFWVLGPDPDGSGSMRNREAVTDYNPDGTVLDRRAGPANADGSGFVELQKVQYGYDAAARPVSQTLYSGGTAYSLTQYSYDDHGRPDCTTVRMNPAAFSSKAGACDLGTQGGFGQDRISRTEYDPAGQVTKTWAGYRTATAYATVYGWTDNGKPRSVVDPNGQTTAYTYDGYDRPQRTCYTAGSCDGANDYEENTAIDENGNVTSRRLRDGGVMTMGYDALDRMTSRGGSVAARSYDYDLQGNLIRAGYANGEAVQFGYDALGRKTSETGAASGGSVATGYQYNAAGQLTWLGYGDGWYVSYNYYATGEPWGVWANGVQNPVAAYYYDDLGRRTGLGRNGNGTATGYGYGGTPWLTSITQDLAGTGSDVTTTFQNNPAGQIVMRASNNEAYSWSQGYSVSRGYQVNGRNQYTMSGNLTLGYDGQGNLNSAPTPGTGGNAQPSGTTGYGYDGDRQLTSVNGAATFTYDALGRLVADQTEQRRFGYAGDRLLIEKDLSNNAIRHYVYGADEAPLVWNEGSATWYMAADERGSVVAVMDGSGNLARANTYDEFGIPGTNNMGRFGYTGQAWNTTLRMWYYKARIYSPTLGRFLQTDPIGYADGLNWYNYAHGDPVNGVDPSGTEDEPDIVVTARKVAQDSSGGSSAPGGEEIVVTGSRPGGPIAPPPIVVSIDTHWTPAPLPNLGSGGGGAPSPSPQNDIVVTAKKKNKQALNFVGNRPPGGPDDDEDPDDYDAYQNDLDKCRAMKGAAAANCYGAAERRRFARNNGKPLPPLARAAAGAAGGVAIGTILYWIISEGSRVLFPPRNLIPVP